MEKLLKYFMDETSKKFDDLNADIHKINERLEDLQTFKIEMMTSAKMTSVIMSGVISITTFITTIMTVYYMVKK